ncbi:MAG: alpha/beta hydrolase [Planctomycetota bacterium]
MSKLNADEHPMKLRDADDGAVLTRFPCPTLRRGVPSPTVLVLPGGGYASLAEHEGEPVARRFNDAGFHAAVLRYRLGPEHRHPAMLHDAQRAMRLLRTAETFPAGKIAVLGFSAGGHLAGTLATHGDQNADPADDLSPSVSARPDAAILAYPVIDLHGEHAHAGSREHLLGPSGGPDASPPLDLHRAVTTDTPPTFLWHTADDESVPVQNSVMFADACRGHGVPHELHVFESGSHGLGLAPHHTAAGWPDLAIAFLRRHLP